jgi:hypothetical protein
MGTPERIYDLVKAMPAQQVDEVLDFVEFLRQKAQAKLAHQTLPQGTLTELRGIAKGAGLAPTDDELREEYTDYLIQKYQ